MKPLSTIIVMLCIASSAPALAEDKAGASSLFKEGNKLRKLEKYKEALEKYKEAYRRFPSFKIQYNIALTLDRLGRSAEAASRYQRFLSVEDGRSHARVRAAKRRLSELRGHLSVIKIHCNVEKALIELDGVVVGLYWFNGNMTRS